MLSRLLLLAMLFASVAVAQQQEQRMIDRLLNPDPSKVNAMGSKSFDTRPYEGAKYEGVREFNGVKSAQTKGFATREFLGIRNPWFGKKVFATEAARDLHRYVLADKVYDTKAVESQAAREDGRTAVLPVRTEADATRPFLGKGKSQAQLDVAYPQGQPLSIDEVRDLLNRPR